ISAPRGIHQLAAPTRQTGACSNTRSAIGRASEGTFACVERWSKTLTKNGAGVIQSRRPAEEESDVRTNPDPCALLRRAGDTRRGPAAGSTQCQRRDPWDAAVA